MPPSRGTAPPPIDTRSFISVAVATFQPSPTAPIRSASGIAHVGQEDLVELGLAGDLAQRPDLHARGGHVAGEVGQALVLGHVRVGAGDQQRPPGQVRRGGPDLLPGHHPAARIPARTPTARVARPARSEPGARLAEQLAPDLLAGPQRAQPALLLLRRAEGQDRRRGHAQPDAVAFGPVVGRARRSELGVDGRLQVPGQSLPAEAGRVVHPGQPGVEARPEELQPVHRRRVVPGQEVADLAAQVRPGWSPAPAAQHSGPPAT